MKILLLNYEYPPLGGGGGYGSQKLAQELTRQYQYEVTVLTASTTSKIDEYFDEYGVRIIRLPITSKREYRSSASIAFMAMYLLRSIYYIYKNRAQLRLSTDIIFTIFAIPTGPVGWFARLILRKPNILQLIGGEILKQPLELEGYKNPVINAVVKFIINAADAVTAISNDTADQTKKLLQVSRDIKVLTLGYSPPTDIKINFDQLTRPSEVDGIIRFVMVSRLVERKGLKYLLEAFSQLNQEGVELHLVGDGPETDSLKSLACLLNIEKKVFFHGFVSESKKFELLLQSDVFVLPTLHEGLGLVYYEAMYAGLPIITTDNGGQMDFLSENNAMIIPIQNVAKLRESMLYAVRNKDWRIRCANNNRIEIEKLFLSKIVADYQKFIQTAVNDINQLH